jgi:AcrR family transcriptional regulator
MRTVEDDRKTAAIIRDAAMDLFGQRGAGDVTIREIASVAGVSPGLVMHHFGSKDGLKDAVDRRVASLFDRMLTALEALGEAGAGGSVAQLMADELERQPGLSLYMRRLLLDGGEAAAALFDRLLEISRSGMRALGEAGIVRPTSDEELRTAFLLVNDLAVILLRDQLTRTTGADPLSRDGLQRWSTTVFDVYTNGVFAIPPADAAAQPGEAPA